MSPPPPQKKNSFQGLFHVKLGILEEKNPYFSPTHLECMKLAKIALDEAVRNSVAFVFGIENQGFIL